MRPRLFEVYLHAGRRRRRILCLTDRQREVLQLAALGHLNADIAEALSVTIATVRKNMQHVFDRTGCGRVWPLR
jgi:DNA-binding CsgD family transcriptional regulator